MLQTAEILLSLAEGNTPYIPERIGGGTSDNCDDCSSDNSDLHRRLKFKLHKTQKPTKFHCEVKHNSYSKTILLFLPQSLQTQSYPVPQQIQPAAFVPIHGIALLRQLWSMN